MTHLDYYQFQARARGVHSARDVAQIAESRAYFYDRALLPWLPADKKAYIVDLACGHGSLLHWLRSRGYQNVLGVDSSPEQIALAETTGARVICAEVNRWLEDNKRGDVGAILAIDLIEHLSKDDFMVMLSTVSAVLQPAGSLILRFPNGDSPFVGRNLFNDITHVWTYTPNCVNSLAAMHGFSAVEFADEALTGIRDHRWLKIPLARICRAILGAVVWAATRERIKFWSPHLWARIVR